jgi:hypothetical protein
MFYLLQLELYQFVIIVRRSAAQWRGVKQVRVNKKKTVHKQFESSEKKVALIQVEMPVSRSICSTGLGECCVVLNCEMR